MLHIAFTIVSGCGRVVIKDNELRVIHDGAHPLGDVNGELAEWLTCKAALRQAGAMTRGAIRLYSDLSVIDALRDMDVKVELPATRFPTGFGRLPQYENAALSHFHDAAWMLATLFGGRWEAFQVERERIVREEAA